VETQAAHRKNLLITANSVMQMEKNGDREVVSRKQMPPNCEQNLPQTSNPDYDFVAAQEYPPVTPAQFYRRFHMCYRADGPHSLGYWQCDHPCQPDIVKALERIPKRRHHIDIRSHDIDVFWALGVVEAIIAWKVVLYQILLLIGPAIFWLLWLTVLGHSGDLQNASIPLMTTLALWAVFRHHVFVG
jgi:hypothetical protein